MNPSVRLCWLVLCFLVLSCSSSNDGGTGPHSGIPTILCEYGYPTDATGIAVNNNIVYISCWVGGLHIFNVSDPSAPVALSNLPLDSWFVDIAYYDNTVFLTGSNEMYIVDVSDPEAPQLVTTYDSSVASVYVSIDNGVACFASPGCELVDVSDPHNPIHLTYIDESVQNGVLVQGGYLYLICENTETNDDGLLEFFDIQNPSQPECVSTYNLPNCMGYGRLALTGTTLYVNAMGLHTFDVTQPSSPDVIGYSHAIYGEDIQAVDNILYTATTMVSQDEGCGVHAYDMSNASEPVKIGQCTFEGGACDLAIDNGFGYTAGDEKGLVVLGL